MAAARVHHIAELLPIHADELAYVAGQRRAALGSSTHTLREFGELNERLEAHLQGLLAAPVAAMTDLLQPQLAAPERDDAFAAAFALLRLAENATTHAVVVEFSRAQGQTLAGLRDALSLAPHALFAAHLQTALEHAKPVTAAAAAVVLANQRLLNPHAARLAQLLQDKDATVCALAWRAAAAADAKAPQLAPPRPFEYALAHEAPAVRHVGWAAVSWSGQQQALPRLRRVAMTAHDPVALHWLAVLGDARDTGALLQAALAAPDGKARCTLLARHGHPSALNTLVEWMSGGDVLLAAAAGESFTRMTGIDIRGQRQTTPVPDDADDFAREMAPDLWLPDVDKARALMKSHGGAWAAGSRWCAGVGMGDPITPEVLAKLDFEARWEAAARAAMGGRMISAPPPIH